MTTKFVVEGLPPLEPIKEISIGEIIYQSLLTHTDNTPAFVDGKTGIVITYPQLLSRTCSLAEALRNTGYGPHSTILVSSKNHVRFFVPVVAALYIGAKVTTMNPNYTPTELTHVMNISQPNIVFCSEDVVHKYADLKRKMNFIEKIIAIDTTKSSVEAESLNDFIRENIRSMVSTISTTVVNTREHVAFILYSSGTTGLPKGVMLTHRNINAKFLIWKDPRLFIEKNRTLCVLPFFHAYGLLTTLTALRANSLTVFLNEFEPEVYMQALQDYKVTRLYLAPSFLLFLAKSPLVLQYDLSSVNEAICGAAPLKKSTEDEFKRRFNVDISQAYGLTESTLAVTINGKTRSKPGSSGKVTPYSRLAIRDLETGKFLGPNNAGEICIKSEMVMKGYCRNPEATKNTFNEDGWLLTGDAGYYDEDGDLFVTDRLKELIKYKGFQVAPAEIEAILLTHDEIIECGVVGMPDERAGEVPLAFVVKLEQSQLTERDIQKFVEEKLSNQKWLRGGVVFVKRIPKNPTGKILRRNLRLMMKQYQSKL